MENSTPYNEWKTAQQEQISRNQKEIESLKKEAKYYMEKYFKLEGEYKKIEVAYIDKLELLQSQMEFQNKLITENRYLRKSLDMTLEELDIAKAKLAEYQNNEQMFNLNDQRK